MDMKNVLFAITGIVISLNVGATAHCGTPWKTLSPGLELGQFLYTTDQQRAVINILRIDMKRYELVLMNASHPDQGSLLTAREWSQKEGLTAAINAAMYQQDYRTSVSLMRTSGHVNNPRVSKDKTILVFEPLVRGIPPVRIVDSECDDFEQIRRQYGSAVQSIRMFSCTGKNVWQQSERRWSITAVGIDDEGRLLFIQCTAPHSVHDFTNILHYDLPLPIDRLMYMEGGSPSQMYISTPADTLEFFGDFSSGGRSPAAPQIPNVLGIRPRR
jgi:uncharacterized protein YigE (DUF2233 family)